MQPPTIAVRLAGGALGAQGVRGGVLTWHLGSGGVSVLLVNIGRRFSAAGVLTAANAIVLVIKSIGLD